MFSHSKQFKKGIKLRAVANVAADFSLFGANVMVIDKSSADGRGIFTTAKQKRQRISQKGQQ
jgi:hypothetical protein